ncbi:MAG: hypothetical protein ACYC27_12745 [Armatimonadota bacterium]
MRIIYRLLIYGLLMVFLLNGCSSPRDKKVRANARVVSNEIEDIIGIDIIADSVQDGIRTPLGLPLEAKNGVIIGSLEIGKDEPDFTEAVSELRKIIRKPSNKYLCLLPKLWLRIRFKDSNYARYCMYMPDDTYMHFEFKGPVDIKSQTSEDEWKTEGFTLKSSKKFREILNRHLPPDWMMPQKR